MTITPSRHAKKRLALYRIDLADIAEIIEAFVAGKTIQDDKYEIVDRTFAAKYSFPLKIVFRVKGSHIVIITAYPLKKGRER